jgi:hypothetical protein
MIQETKNFKKRFYCTSIPEKMRIAQLLGNCVAKSKMPTGRAMTAKEKELLSELCEWCNTNIFFDNKPSTL